MTVNYDDEEQSVEKPLIQTNQSFGSNIVRNYFKTSSSSIGNNNNIRRIFLNAPGDEVVYPTVGQPQYINPPQQQPPNYMPVPQQQFPPPPYPGIVPGFPIPQAQGFPIQFQDQNTYCGVHKNCIACLAVFVILSIISSIVGAAAGG
jgi:hypothetical protein